VKKRKARNFEEFLARKKAKAAATPPDNRPSVMEAVLGAVSEGPVSPAELAARVMLLRPGTQKGEIPKTAYAWKIRGRIEKRAGRWCVVETQEAPREAVVRASAPKAAAPEAKEPSIRHLIRTAIAKGQNPTADEIVERVQRAKPELPAANIRTALGQLMISGEAKQTFGGQIVPVALKLPAAATNGAH
jgi:hypothetical protein